MLNNCEFTVFLWRGLTKVLKKVKINTPVLGIS